MKREELEYLLSQFVDGTLSEFDRARVDELLSSSSEAREILGEYEKLNRALRSLPTVPDLNWTKVQTLIQGAIADADAPVRNYTLDFAIWSRRLAAVATIVIVAGLGWTLLRNSPSDPSIATMGTPIVQIAGPQVERASAPAFSDISIGPANETVDWSVRYEQTLVSRPGRVVIATGSSIPQDTTPTY
jgi:anti-sigma factor RsiW